MGAIVFSDLVLGKFKSHNEAIRFAREDAKDCNGHQDGYSGDIQTCDSVRLLHAHPRFNTKAFDKWRQDTLDDLSKREAVIVEIKGAPLKRRKDARGWKGMRGVRGFYIFGWGAY